MGFFRDVDEGKIDGGSSFKAEDMLDSFDDITADDAFASMEGAMTAEEALASLDADYVKEMESAVSELSGAEKKKAVDEVPDLTEASAQDGQELTLEDVLADLPDMVSYETTEDDNHETKETADAADNTADNKIEAGTDESEQKNNKEDMSMLGEAAQDNAQQGDTMSHETTVISKGTTIRGGISSDCSLDVMGVITGDVDCQGKLCIYGTVSGNTSAAEIYVETSNRINGDLISTGNVKISDKSVIIGTIQAASAFVAGAVKGDLDIDGPVVIDSSAVIDGNITAKSLQLNAGAVLQGVCNIGTKEKDISSVFAD